MILFGPCTYNKVFVSSVDDLMVLDHDTLEGVGGLSGKL